MSLRCVNRVSHSLTLFGSAASAPYCSRSHGVTAHRRQPTSPSLTVTGLRQAAPYYSVLTVDNLLRVSSSRWSQVTGLTAQPLPAACLFPYCSSSAPSLTVIARPRMEGDNSHVGGCDSFSPTPMSSPVEYPNSSPVDSPSARNEAETQETQGTSQTVEGELEPKVGDKRLRSTVWEHFTKIQVNGLNKAECSEDYEIDEDLLLPQQLEA
nr:hypothetical protein L195_g052894 [Ipomoea batatas]